MPKTPKPPKPTRAKLYKQSKALAKKLKLNQDDFKKLYRKSTSKFWTAKIAEFVEMEKNMNSSVKPIKDIHYRGYESRKVLNDSGLLKYHHRIHTLKNPIALVQENLKLIKKQVEHVASMHILNKKDDTVMYKVVVESNDGRHISTPAMKSIHAAIKFLVDNHLRPKASAYEGSDYLIAKVHFTTVKSSIMCGYSASQIEANDK